MNASAWENTEILWNACVLSLWVVFVPSGACEHGRGVHERDLLQLREEVTGLMHILAHVDTTEHHLIRVTGLFSLLSPVTEPQALQAALQHGSKFPECKH